MLQFTPWGVRRNLIPCDACHMGSTRPRHYTRPRLCQATFHEMTSNMLSKVHSPIDHDLATLCALAHTGWLTSSQIHRLCFPNQVVATVRLTLRYLAEAGWIKQLRWRVGRADGGRTWAITRRGVAMIGHYCDIKNPTILQDHRRPSSSLEQEEWHTQLRVRELVTALICSARQRALMSRFAVTLPVWPPPPQRMSSHDADLAVVWGLRKRQEATWLPWPTPELLDLPITWYMLFIARRGDANPMRRVMASVDESNAIPILVLEDSMAQLKDFQHLMLRVGERPILLGTWTEVIADPGGLAWRDTAGRPCLLDIATIKDTVDAVDSTARVQGSPD